MKKAISATDNDNGIHVTGIARMSLTMHPHTQVELVRYPSLFGHVITLNTKLVLF